MNPSVDKDAVNRQVEDLKATINKKLQNDAVALANEARIRKQRETLPFRFNQDIKYQVGPYKNFIHTDDSLIKQDIQVTY